MKKKQGRLASTGFVSRHSPASGLMAVTSGRHPRRRSLSRTHGEGFPKLGVPLQGGYRGYRAI